MLHDPENELRKFVAKEIDHALTQVSNMMDTAIAGIPNLETDKALGGTGGLDIAKRIINEYRTLVIQRFAEGKSNA